MTTQALVFDAPIPDSAWTSHPALIFLANYQRDYTQNFHTVDPEKFYNKKCKIHYVDGTVGEGSQILWNFFDHLYGRFPKVTRDILSLIVFSNDASGTHRVHVELVTNLHCDADGEKADEGTVLVPQSFVYTIGKADPGKGCDGLQFQDLRCYYDYSLIRKAHAMV